MKRDRLNYLLLILAFTVNFGCNTYSQGLQTGAYDIGAIAVSEGIITGFIEEGIGDEEYDSPVRTCFVYFEGRYSESGIHSIHLWDTYSSREIKRYSGTIEPDPELKENFIIRASDVPNVGICPTSTFKKLDKGYLSSMLLGERKKWKSLLMVKASEVQIYAKSDMKSESLGTVSKHDVVKILDEEGEWYGIEISEKAKGWILKDSLFSLDG